MVHKEIPVSVVYENEKTLAFDDINPVAPVHTLIIPKGHYSDLLALSEKNYDILAALLDSVQKVVHIKNLSESGFRTVINMGQDGQQTVGHLHVHVLGGRKLNWPPG